MKGTPAVAVAIVRFDVVRFAVALILPAVFTGLVAQVLVVETNEFWQWLRGWVNEAADASAEVEVIDCEFFELAGGKYQIEDTGNLPLAFEPLPRLVTAAPCARKTWNGTTGREQAADGEVRLAPICDLGRLL